MYGCWFFLMVDQGFYGIKPTLPILRVNLRRLLPLKSCALCVLVSYVQTTCWCDFLENQRKLAGLCAPSSNLVLLQLIALFDFLSHKPVCIERWKWNLSSLTLLFLVGKRQWKGWIKRTAIYVVESLEVLWYRSRRRHILESLWPKMSRPVEIVKGQQAWVFFACYKHQFLIFFRCWIRRLLNFWLQWIIHCGTWNSLQRGRIFRLLFVLLYRPWVESAPLDTNIRLYSPLGKKNNPSFGISRCFGSKFLWKFFLATLMRFGTDQPWSTKVSGLVHLGMNDDINPVWVVYIKHFFDMSLSIPDLVTLPLEFIWPKSFL